MIIQEAFLGAKVFDTRAPVTPALLALAKAAGFDCAMRYLDLITVRERDAILAAGLAVMICSPCRGPGWAPSGPLGLADGQRNLAQAQAVGLELTTVMIDVEAVGPDPTGLQAYVNNWAALFSKPGLYYGAGALLTSPELYALLVRSYWRGQSRPIDRNGNLQEPACGNAMVQLYPSTFIGNTAVDVSFIQKDFIGRMVTWCAP